MEEKKKWWLPVIVIESILILACIVFLAVHFHKDHSGRQTDADITQAAADAEKETEKALQTEASSQEESASIKETIPFESKEQGTGEEPEGESGSKAALPAATSAGEKATKQPDSTAPTQNTTVTVESGTPFENHGKLSVSGTNLVDSKGNPYQLKGVSTHGIAWFPDYINQNAFATLRDDWGANLIRVAMYTAEYGGYCSGGNQADLEKLVDNAVTYATQLGMYVIIDWHILSDGNPNTNLSSAKTFWKKISAKYSGYDNVLYEICNEPNGCAWSDVKSYADTIIPLIRANDPDAVIIVGTPTWSQDVDQVAANPLKQENRKNVMYACHFYAATHGDNIRNKVKTAIAAGTPVFISEFSICDASGNGGIDYTSAETWKKLINDYNLSYAGWSLSNKAETSALIRSGCTKLSGWSSSDLSDTGNWLRTMLGGSGNGNTGNSQTVSTEKGQSQTAAAQETTQKAAETTTASGGTYQFEVTVTNTSGNDLSDWEINAKLPSGCSIVSGWCSTYSLSGTNLNLKPLDYNANLPAGASAGGIGIQITSPSALSDFTVTGNGVSAEFHMTNSW